MRTSRLAIVALSFLIAAPVAAEQVRPVSLLSSSSIRVDSGAGAQTLRLVGLVSPRDPACMQAELVAFAQALDSPLNLTTDAQVAATGEDGSVHRYASKTGLDIGEDAIRRGLALAASGPFDRMTAYLAAENVARKAQRGIWQLGCAATLAATMQARTPAPPQQLPRGSSAAAKEALAELHRRNDSGENRQTEVHVEVVAERPPDEPAAPVKDQGDAAPSGDEPYRGHASTLSGPRIVRLDGGRVRVEGKLWNTGDVELRGRIRIELRDDGSLVDSTTVRMTLPANGEAPYSVEMNPGVVQRLTATATWQDG